ncbi:MULTISPECIES: hypothetical protein [unclassified Gordonia (in: high G+C Gram-positive bacteria)]
MSTPTVTHQPSSTTPSETPATPTTTSAPEGSKAPTGVAPSALLPRPAAEGRISAGDTSADHTNAADTSADDTGNPVDTSAPVLLMSAAGAAPETVASESTSTDDIGTTRSTPAGLLAVAQSALVGSATPTNNDPLGSLLSLFSLPRVVVPSFPPDLDNPAWVAQWRAFDSSVVVWVPGASAVLGRVSLAIDAYLFVRAVENHDEPGVADEIGYLSGDVVTIYFGRVAGTAVGYVVHAYVAPTVAEWIVAL